jgi:D-serine deaminase-like pyridoxal phosphate-dependent protein
VIGHQREKGWVIVDAGWMAMSRDRGTQRQTIDYGYGIVCDAAGRAIEGLLVTAANQEHGIISRRDGSEDAGLVERFPIGTKLRVLPNHACATGAQYPDYHLVTAEGAALVWPRFHGW